jgi:hypothetical protein
MRYLRWVVAAALLTVPSIAVATPASAARWSREDPAGDVYVVDRAMQVSGWDVTQRNGDIEKVVVRNTGQGVVVVQDYFELDVPTDQTLALDGMVATSDGTAWFFEMARGRSCSSETCIFYNGMAWNQDGEGRTCSEASFRLDTVANQYRVLIPRACLGRPRWVEVAVNTYGWGATDWDPEWADNGMVGRDEEAVFSPVLSPRIPGPGGPSTR